MFCPRCGANNDSTQRFCYNCGQRLETAASGQTNPPVQAPMIPPLATPPVYDQNLPLPPAPPAYSDMAGYGPVTQNSGLAIASLVCGILAWVGLLPLIGAVAAVITGHMARNEIRNSGGRTTGNGLALAGLILGYAQIALLAVAICLLVVIFVGAAASGG